MAHESDARPVVLFNKIDLCGNLNARLANATCVAGNALVLAACAVTGRGVKKLAQLIKPGDTGVFIGTSGVGKSSLINRLYGEDILWMANSCPRSDWQLGKPGAKGLELLIFDHIPVPGSSQTVCHQKDHRNEQAKGTNAGTEFHGSIGANPDSPGKRRLLATRKASYLIIDPTIIKHLIRKGSGDATKTPWLQKKRPAKLLESGQTWKSIATNGIAD